MTRTKLFRSNRSQAVRWPKSLAFPDSIREVSIAREGKRQVIVPANVVWDDFFDSPGIDLPARSELMGSLYPKEYTGWGLSLDKHPRVLRAEYQTGV